MLTLDPAALTNQELYQYLVGCIVPRPIAFVSTLDATGQTNLAPFSYFNVFSAKPPVCIFSVSYTAGQKDTLRNVEALRECVINIVSHSIIEQMVMCSANYPAGVSEFEQSGLTPLPSERVRPPRVAESPVQLECSVRDILPLGEAPGAGNLVLCDIVRLHLSPDILDERGRIDPHRLDAMGRMGRAFYVRSSGPAVHRYYQERTTLGLGWNALPESARQSQVLTGNDLGRLARQPQPPTPEAIAALAEQPDVQALLGADNAREEIHTRVRFELAQNNVDRAAALVWLAATLPATDNPNP